ncbi:MAG: polysaccharide deacetylase family protein, partial [Anaerolineae bacterium]|nr:polysaccharide deacetylase family protein [Anaerolineae bacterium]
MKKSQVIMGAARKAGLPGLLDLYWGQDRITVLAHHRVTDAGKAADFPYYQPNISATPAQFDEQLAYIAAHFSVIGLHDLVAYVVENKPLPPRPLLITFDDGYLDNYQHAFPVLQRYGFPAVIFLMTSRMTHSAPPWWDECAYYFFHTTREDANLPLVGPQRLDSPAARLAGREAVLQAMERVPEAQKLAALQELGRTLAVAPPPLDPGLFMNWDQARDLVNNGVACMPHTVTHPILTRVSPEQQRQEIVDS